MTFLWAELGNADPSFASACSAHQRGTGYAMQALFYIRTTTLMGGRPRSLLFVPLARADYVRNVAIASSASKIQLPKSVVACIAVETIRLNWRFRDELDRQYCINLF